MEKNKVKDIDEIEQLGENTENESTDAEVLDAETSEIGSNEEESQYKYKFSIITAVYNVEPFIAECIDSIIEQNIGFEANVQMILIDDGSKDRSGEICDEYAEKYPDNIIVVHKENGGVSSARNLGIELAEGEFVNFLDSDDMLARNTLSGVYKFFLQNKKRTDMVSIPMYFFEGMTGPHALNYKFSKGSRVIFLDSEWTAVQNSLASAFVKLESIKKYRFDTRLTNLEDAQVVQKVLSEKCTLGVFAKAKYLYRKRTVGEASAVQTATVKPTWYNTCLKYFHYEIIDFYMSNYGYLPRFVQYIITYDLQWRITQGNIPEGVLTEEEEREYYELLYGLFKYIEDSVIWSQKSIWNEHKMFMLRKKYGGYPVKMMRGSDIALRYENTVVSQLSSVKMRLELLRVEENEVIISGRVTLMGFEPDEPVKVFANVVDDKYEAQFEARPELTVRCFDETVLAPSGFIVRVPLLADASKITFSVSLYDVEVPINALVYGALFPIQKAPVTAYTHLGDYIFVSRGAGIVAVKATPKLVREKEKAYLRTLWKSGDKPMRKAAIARRLNTFFTKRKKRPIWIISDRIERASDNGEALALYMKDNVKDIDSYFCLCKSSPDYERLKKMGLKILEPNSWDYKVKFLQADVLLSSQAEDAFLRPMLGYTKYYNDIVVKKKIVFLQHGITQNDVSKYYGKYASNISLFITAAQPERDSIINGTYNYRPEEVALTGFARYDRLYTTNDKTVVFAPTWRSSLVGKINTETGKRTALPTAENSTYCRTYSELLSHPRLIEAAKKYGYKLKFAVHPNMVDVMQYMHFDPSVETFAPDAEYRDIFAQGSLMVTDYSSVAFDFAYLRKPILYFQFDIDEFFSGSHTLNKGYFDCERDGFGELETDVESTVDRIIEYMAGDCQLKDKYRGRVDSFFAYNDKDNCKRIVEKTKEMVSEG